MFLMFIGPCIIAIVDEWKTDLMSLAILFHLLCAQHVSDINISITGSLRLCWWITTSVVLFSVRCVLEIWCSWFWVVFVLQASAFKTNITQNQPHQVSNTRRTENKTTDVVIHQHSRKLLKMDILMSETCWAHNKWNKIASDIKLVFHSSNKFLVFENKFLRVITNLPRATPIERSSFLISSNNIWTYNNLTLFNGYQTMKFHTERTRNFFKTMALHVVSLRCILHLKWTLTFSN